MATPVRMPPRHRASRLHASHRTTDRTTVPGRRTGPQGASRYDTGHLASARGAGRGAAQGATPTVAQGVAHGTRHRLSPLALGVPLVLGIIYGAYAAAIARDGGPATYGQLALALVSGAALLALLVGLLLVQRSLPREIRAVAWGAVVAAPIGFLMCLSGHSVFSSSGLALFVAACTAAAVFYRLYTKEPSQPRAQSQARTREYPESTRPRARRVARTGRAR
ncbi:hypothetical protein [Streptomyces sp. NBC_01429]|uniref:hypothetical protein n=1 Tax=Streptomyces sp. NBC_01429 TaxID=2903862 RepID=UPI002E29FDE8|nr:hypothetical protein [Streptomyces sp. NBC_01429]